MLSSPPCHFVNRRRLSRHGSTGYHRSNSVKPHHIPGKPERRGVAVVEVALCLPVLLLVTLLFIEFTNLIFLRQTVKVASYEGIRVAVKQGADLSDVTGICGIILDGREVVEYEISVEPEDFSTLQRGTLVTVTIAVDKAENQLFGLLLGSNANVEVQSFGLKE